MYFEKYKFPLEKFISRNKFEEVKDFSKDRETPFLLIDLNVVERKYKELRDYLPFAKIYYAVKSNPDKDVISSLERLGSNFDIATKYELDQILELGISPDRCSYGNPIKKAKDIEYAYNRGVRIFTTDSFYDLDNLGIHAPGSKIFFRLLTDGLGADWPLSRKFGVHQDMIYELILHAQKKNLVPYGLSFHVGSQQRDIGHWDDAISRCYYIMQDLKDYGIKLQALNLGGGFPANYLKPTLSTEIYCSEIKRFLKEYFEGSLPEIWIEPGRSITGDSGIIVSEVVLISKKSKNNLYNWVNLDVGMFGGLIETINESIKYPIFFDAEGEAEEVILTGPTCDSIDVLYEDYKYRMPSKCKPGDKVYIFTTGAYTMSYSSVCFNGIPPLKTYVFRSSAPEK